MTRRIVKREENPEELLLEKVRVRVGIRVKVRVKVRVRVRVRVRVGLRVGVTSRKGSPLQLLISPPKLHSPQPDSPLPRRNPNCKVLFWSRSDCWKRMLHNPILISD